jgi:chemotaxis response regulator CheB
MEKGSRIRALIVDDSAVVREALKEILSSDPEIEVIGTAGDPYVAAERISEEVPDVIILDIEMPRMDGLTFLKKIMSQHPIPVVICSSLADEGALSTLKALEYGAVEIITKPKLGTRQFLEESKVALCQSLKAAASARLRPPATCHTVEPKLTADAVLSRATKAMVETTEKVVVVGASTGGTEALKTFLEALPADSPGVVIVQHMPELFTRAFANRLDGLCAVSVKEAETNDTVLRGRVLIAPRQSSSAAEAQRRAILRRSERWPACVPSPSIGRRALPLRCSLRGTERCWRHYDWNGGRRCPRHVRNEAGWRLYHRPGRGDLYRFRDAQRGHQAQWGQQGASTRIYRQRNPEPLPLVLTQATNA